MIELSVCENPDVLRIIYFAKILIDIVKTIIPIALIIMVIVDAAKGVMSGDSKIGDKLKLNANRLIYAILIFCVPTIVNIVLEVIDEQTAYESCLVNAEPSTIEYYQALYDSMKEEESYGDQNNFITSDSSITFSYEWITDKEIPYALYTPSSASSNQKTPLIVWLHGSGEINASESTFKSRGLPAVLGDWKLDGFNAYVLCPRSSGDWSKHREQVYSIIDSIIKQKNINTDKIILVGHSMGSRGVYTIANGNTDYFSAFVFLSGYNANIDLEQFKDDPLKGYVGTVKGEDGQDGEDPSSYNYMKKTFSNAFGADKLTVLDTHHGGVPKVAFNLDENNDNKSDLIEWMLTQ